jgi:lipopolysaccharide biosynthesis glycosyltransferase
MKVAFCTHVSDDWYYSVGAHKLSQSLKYFHPEIDFYCFGDKQLNELFTIHPNVNWNTVHPFVSYQLIDQYDMVVHFDADSMIVGKLDELLVESNLEFDIIGVRNNNDFNKAGKDNPITNPGLDTQKYLNAGLVAITNKAFVEQWMVNNTEFGNQMPFQEQTVLNFMTKDWKTKIIDPIESNVYYGISNLYGDNTHWDSWMDIQLIENELILNNKKVKVLHHGGGHGAIKLDFNLFNKEVKQHLNKIYESNN